MKLRRHLIGRRTGERSALGSIVTVVMLAAGTIGIVVPHAAAEELKQGTAPGPVQVADHNPSMASAYYDLHSDEEEKEDEQRAEDFDQAHLEVEPDGPVDSTSGHATGKSKIDVLISEPQDVELIQATGNLSGSATAVTGADQPDWVISNAGAFTFVNFTVSAEVPYSLQGSVNATSSDDYEKTEVTAILGGHPDQGEPFVFRAYSCAGGNLGPVPCTEPDAPELNEIGDLPPGDYQLSVGGGGQAWRIAAEGSERGPGTTEYSADFSVAMTFGEAGCDNEFTEGADVIVGTALDDVLCGGGGNDTITGGDGDDTIFGESGDDTIDGGNDTDTLEGGTGNDAIDGGRGTDSITGGADNDTIDGDIGPDTITGDDGNDTITGGAAADRIDGGAGTDTINAGAGNDKFVDGGDGNDKLHGGDGSDGSTTQVTFTGGPGEDRVFGDDGSDGISGGADSDFVNGGRSPDRVLGQDGDDELLGGSDDATDELVGGDGDDTLEGGDGKDGLRGDDGVDKLRGQSGPDCLTGGANRDVFVGGAGNDKLFSRDNVRDVLHGNAGSDRARIDSGLDAVDGVENRNFQGGC